LGFFFACGGLGMHHKLTPLSMNHP